MYICLIVSSVDVNECTFCVNEQQKVNKQPWEQILNHNEYFIQDLPSQVRLTANFLNKPLSEDIINRIAEQCSFNGMTKDLSRYTVRFNEGQTSILRKGVVGDWKNYFTPELNERFEKEVLSKIEGTGLEFDFEL